MSQLLVSTFLLHMLEANHTVCFTTFGRIIKQAQTMHPLPSLQRHNPDSAHVILH